MKQLLPLVHLRSDQPELIRTTLLAWVLVWSWQEEAVQALVQQLQRTNGTQDELREEYFLLVQQWEAEEGNPSEEDHPSKAPAKPQLPAYLSSPQPAKGAPSRWILSCCSIQWMQAVVQGQWSWQQMLALLPRLARFFCPSPRRRRSQRFQLEAWVRFRLAKLSSP